MERVRVLEGLGQTDRRGVDPSLTDQQIADAIARVRDQFRTIVGGPFDRLPDAGSILDPVMANVPRSVSRLASAYQWRSPNQRAAFETCAETAVGGCLRIAQPDGAGIDPAVKSLLIGAGLGFALARGGGVVAAVVAGLWLLRGQSVGQAVGI